MIQKIIIPLLWNNEILEISTKSLTLTYNEIIPLVNDNNKSILLFYYKWNTIKTCISIKNYWFLDYNFTFFTFTKTIIIFLIIILLCNNFNFLFFFRKYK